MPDYYDLLGVKDDATDEEIKKAFREKAFEHHPDTNPSSGAAKRFHDVKEAYECLRNPTRRASYDAIRNSDFSDYPSTSGTGGRQGRGKDFEDAFERWWKKRERDFAQQQQQPGGSRRMSAAEQHAYEAARAAAWEEEKFAAQFAKERQARLRRRMEDAKQERTARTLRQFWQTHQGITWQDLVFVAVVLGGAAYTLQPQLWLARGATTRGVADAQPPVQQSQ